jgi:prepilin-type processing-associated H-X9-DG protein
MSMWVVLLGHLEQQPLSNAWNFSLSWNDPTVSAMYGPSCIVAANTTVAVTNINVFNCPTDVRAQSTYSTTGSGRNDIPKAANLALSSYSPSAGVNGPPNVGADTFGRYTTPDVKHLNNGFADYGIPRRLKTILDGTSNTIAVGEVTYDNDGSWYATQPTCSGFNPQFNAWTISLRLGSNFRVTRNPMNTLPGLGTSAGGVCGQNSAFGSRHTGGANFLFADGSVKFLKNSISMPVYWALSTRAEGEVISSDSY